MATIKSMRALWVSFIAIAVFDGAVAAKSNAGCPESGPPRIVHRSFVRRDIVEPGLYPVSREPSLYGWHSKAVEVPGPVVWHEEPPVYRTVTTRVRRPGGWAWEERVIHGKAVMCRVRRPSTFEAVERHVLVRPARRWAERTTSIAYVHRRILLRPYKNIVHYQPPHVHWWRERLAIQPEDYRWLPARPDC